MTRSSWFLPTLSGFSRRNAPQITSLRVVSRVPKMRILTFFGRGSRGLYGRGNAGGLEARRADVREYSSDGHSQTSGSPCRCRVHSPRVAVTSLRRGSCEFRCECKAHAGAQRTQQEEGRTVVTAFTSNICCNDNILTILD